MRTYPEGLARTDTAGGSMTELLNVVGPQAAPLLVSIPAAAHLLSVGRSTIYELIWKGDLTAIKIGRCVRIRRLDLEDYVDRIARRDRSVSTPAS